MMGLMVLSPLARPSRSPERTVCLVSSEAGDPGSGMIEVSMGCSEADIDIEGVTGAEAWMGPLDGPGG